MQLLLSCVKSFLIAVVCFSTVLFTFSGCSSDAEEPPEISGLSSWSDSFSVPDETTPPYIESIPVSSTTATILEEMMTVPETETDATDRGDYITEEAVPENESEIGESEAESSSRESVDAESDLETSVAPHETMDALFSDGGVDNNNYIVSAAETLIGINFAEGGSSPETGFDNSGFIYYVLRQNGYINCPRMTSEQSVMGVNIPAEKLRPGDLVFFSNGDSGKADFGGIYAGGGKMIYSPMPGQSVKYADITSSYWVSSFFCAVSLN